ncbi:hypothetical protein GPECTOR_6g766 [Gonium pectorale]|uniref:WW domain-containing protein n=1 Tax=Gonium pectorale TaxID=33097 RepID=A0A150GVY1_GONPE|nr:hypothetical protein GPECTOR_6g766 [Gonium pectorale]|eukprot:KXZ53848.1 hypothetical protein GPECTOR_6g766 [Gonium pectorale]
MGVDVRTAPGEFLDFQIYYRGTRLKKIQWRRWGIFKRQIEMNVYERLAVIFRLKKPLCKDDMPEDATALGVDNRPWYKKLFCNQQVGVSASLKELRDEFLYMKLFKDVLQCDVDMLLPGAVIKFTWLDYVMIWGPILFGCGCAVWKAIQGTISFSNLTDALLSIVLIVMPLSWGVRAYMAIKEKQRLHQARLNALMLLHNLNNNAGVVSQLLEEAQEQEDNEAMLAYFFLWRGAPSPQPVRKLDLDRAVEAYLQRKLDESGCSIRMDFEVTDSVLKLERMGLLRTVMGDKQGEKLLQVVPLDQALEKAHVRHFDEAQETGHFLQPRSKAKRQGAVGMVWHECMDVFRPTGQAFRYWWNAATGESTYYEPDEPYIKLSPDKALELSQAHVSP